MQATFVAQFSGSPGGFYQTGPQVTDCLSLMKKGGNPSGALSRKKECCQTLDNSHTKTVPHKTLGARQLYSAKKLTQTMEKWLKRRFRVGRGQFPGFSGRGDNAFGPQ